MKTRNVNISLAILVLIFVLIIFGINRKENYSGHLSGAPVPQHPPSTYLKKKKDLEEFKGGFQGGRNRGYHGGNSYEFPLTTYTLNESPSQTKQILNRLTFDYPSVYDDPYRYPNVVLPPTVIGCGGRRGACMGGSQVPIPNTLPPVNISETNIAPVNLTVRGFDEGIQQVGTIQKVFGRDNLVYPLFGRKKYRNDNKWEYFVKFGQYGVILPVVRKRHYYDELNTNDEVYIQGQSDKYRVTMYDEDIPQYLPFA